MNVIFERLEHLCHEKGITITELERKSGLGNSTIRKWKVDNNFPRLDKLHIIANYLDTTVSYLIGETDIPNKSVQKSDDSISDEDNTMVEMTIEELDLSVPRIPPEKLAQIEQYAEFVTGKKVKLHNGKPKGKLTLEDVRQALETMNQLADDFEKKQNMPETEASLKSFPKTDEAEKIS